MNYIQSAIDDLRKHYDRANSLVNIDERINALKENVESIKAVATDNISVQGGGTQSDERIINTLSEIERLKYTRDSTNTLVKLVERGLQALSSQERRTLEKFYMQRTKKYIEELKDEFGYEQSQIYNIKDAAIKKFTIAMYGLIDY